MPKTPKPKPTPRQLIADALDALVDSGHQFHAYEIWGMLDGKVDPAKHGATLGLLIQMKVQANEIRTVNWALTAESAKHSRMVPVWKRNGRRKAKVAA